MEEEPKGDRERERDAGPPAGLLLRVRTKKKSWVSSLLLLLLRFLIFIPHHSPQVPQKMRLLLGAFLSGNLEGL